MACLFNKSQTSLQVAVDMRARRDPPAADEEVKNLVLSFDINRDFFRQIFTRGETIPTPYPSLSPSLATLLNDRALDRQIMSRHNMQQLFLNHHIITHTAQSLLFRLQQLRTIHLIHVHHHNSSSQSTLIIPPIFLLPTTFLIEPLYFLQRSYPVLTIPLQSGNAFT